MKRTAWGVFSCVAGLLFVGSQARLTAAITCTDADYNGHYAFSSVGELLQLPPAGAALLGTIAQSGRFDPDGKGNVPIETTVSYNGFITTGNTPGATYSVSPDCVITFYLTLPFPLSVPSQFQGILSRDDQQMVLMLTVPSGTVIIGQHIKQKISFCGLQDFSGAYQVELSGTISAPASLAGQFRRVGRLVADGEGNFSAVTPADYNGKIVPEIFQGTYTVNSECFVTLTYTTGSGASAQTFTINGALGGNGEIAMVLVLNSGWGVAGTLRAQQGAAGEQLEIR